MLILGHNNVLLVQTFCMFSTIISSVMFVLFALTLGDELVLIAVLGVINRVKNVLMNRHIMIS